LRVHVSAATRNVFPAAQQPYVSLALPITSSKMAHAVKAVSADTTSPLSIPAFPAKPVELAAVLASRSTLP